MKLLPIFFIVLMFQSCADKKAGANAIVTAPEMGRGQKLQNSAADFVPKKVVSLNFETLEKNYFQKQNDSIYVINFWATWCKPCVKELPAFEKIASNYADEKVKILLVSLDFPDKIEEQVIPFIKSNRIKSEVVLLDDADANSWIPKVSPEWSGAIPATVIYRNDHRKFYEKTFTFQEIEAELHDFL